MQQNVVKFLPGLLIVALVLAAVPAFAQSHEGFITGPIKTGPEATQQCLECHEEEGQDFLKTSHWNWGLDQKIHGQMVKRGKRNAINNFCTSATSNEVFCASCHAGYGMTDLNTYDFSNAGNIDCLVCHDTTGSYIKAKGTAGAPAEGVDLLYVAQHVGKPVRDNCGSCHFYGGGGDAVKHGDLDSSMAYPDASIDVHMNIEGNDFQCQTCHETEHHKIPGNSLGVSPSEENHFGCEKCHDEAPHQEARLNQHVKNVACQTCHIPFFAKQIPTKLEWDWSTAGKDLEGEHVDENGMHTYVKKKGNFKWGKMVQPEYAWNKHGTGDVYLVGEKIDPNKMTKLAYPTATIKTDGAKISPFKVHRGKQIYDKKTKVFITAKVYGDGGYWKDFDWDLAAKLGMEANPIMKEKGLSYSGEYGFAPTEMYWQINHMVAPAKDALKCLECHGDNGRMKWQDLGYKGDPMTNPKWARK